jgi:uncharacterized protein with PQ loop repeat
MFALFTAGVYSRMVSTKVCLMPPNPAMPISAAGMLKRLLGVLSIFTMLMTIPQVLTIWITHQAAGVSMLSWGAYLISAVTWLWYGLQKRDKNIYLPCIGWILLDSAVIVGVAVYG